MPAAHLRLESKPAGQKLVPRPFRAGDPRHHGHVHPDGDGDQRALLLVIERRQGLLRRLAYTPLSRLAIVLGKWGGKLVLGLIQIGLPCWPVRSCSG